MTDPEARQFEAVDRLVRDHLDREADRVDASALLARLRDRPRGSARPASRLRSLGWPAAAAAIVIGAFLGGRHFPVASANAATILRNVRVAHAGGIDRCYRVHYAPDPRSWDGKDVLSGPSESVLWTRGDRFWSDCKLGNARLAIGRDADRRLWVTGDPDKGVRFDEESELPERIAILCEVNAMTVPALVDDVLAGFDLRAEAPSDRENEAVSLVWARLKPGRAHPLLSAALLEIDARSDALVRLVLWTVRDGRPNGTVTYTLLESGTQADPRYQLESHLDPGAEIETQRLQRREP